MATYSEAGICKLKPEYIVPEKERQINLSYISNEDKTHVTESTEKLTQSDNYSPAEKKSKPSFKDRKKLKGQNKARGPTYIRDLSKELCVTLEDFSDKTETQLCQKENCKFLHNIPEYLKNKPEDIGPTCYNYNIAGKCPRGLRCRFGSAHTTSDGKNIVDENKFKEYENLGPYTKNQLPRNIQQSLWKKKYRFELSEKVIHYNDNIMKNNKIQKEEDSKTNGTITDEDIINLLSREKKRIDWKDKLMLSPLTTVGNLPFRRICKEFGADITCGEMAMCQSLIKGSLPEWALIKRHKTEDIFGVQLCGNNPYLLTKCVELLQNEFEVDFIDLNLGCPIDLVYKQGGGAGLVARQNVLQNCVRSMSSILSIPLTVKIRTGISAGENIAHKLAPKFREWGASLMTIHGRSREQRYTKSADWEYIKEVVDAAHPMPVYGNGDILSYEQYKNITERIPKMAGVMIGRGGLIKPWIFTEIKEQKLWDIRSSERFDILKKYVNYGLEHWGSDNKGVENTRRFLLEWLSFLYRYVPVGLLEAPPQKINERPPPYMGRDDLETLMASPSASDWIKISEMLLGPVPDNFVFLPKHKANSYN